MRLLILRQMNDSQSFVRWRLCLQLGTSLTSYQTRMHHPMTPREPLLKAHFHISTVPVQVSNESIRHLILTVMVSQVVANTCL